MKSEEEISLINSTRQTNFRKYQEKYYTKGSDNELSMDSDSPSAPSSSDMDEDYSDYEKEMEELFPKTAKLRNKRKKALHKVSPPHIATLTGFEEDLAGKMTYPELLDQLVRHLKEYDKLNYYEATYYYHHLLNDPRFNTERLREMEKKLKQSEDENDSHLMKILDLESKLEEKSRKKLKNKRVQVEISEEGKNSDAQVSGEEGQHQTMELLTENEYLKEKQRKLEEDIQFQKQQIILLTNTVSDQNNTIQNLRTELEEMGRVQQENREKSIKKDKIQQTQIKLQSLATQTISSLKTKNKEVQTIQNADSQTPFTSTPKTSKKLAHLHVDMASSENTQNEGSDEAQTITKLLELQNEKLSWITKHILEQGSIIKPDSEENSITRQVNNIPLLTNYSDQKSQFNDSSQFPSNLKTNISKSALLLTWKTETASLLTMRELLSQEIRTIPDIPRFYTTPTRNRKSLIIKTQKEEDTSGLAEQLSKSSRISEKIDIKHLTQWNKHLIILGIPVTVEPSEILQALWELDNRISKETTYKVINNSSRNVYQLKITLDMDIAQHLLSIGKLNINFIECYITSYRPIIRCGHCQRYGHSKDNCRNVPSCAYCRETHISENCTRKGNPEQYECTNCYSLSSQTGQQLNYNHCASSSRCLVFQSKIKDRRGGPGFGASRNHI